MEQEKLNKIINKVTSFKYGWVDKNNVLHEGIDQDYLAKFTMQTNEEILKSNHAVCWEVVEFIREYLEKENIDHKTYLIETPSTGHHCHSFIVATINNKLYWIEGTLKGFIGIHEHNNIDEVFNILINNFDIIAINKKYELDDIHIYEFNKPKDHIKCFDYFMNAWTGKKIR